MINTEHFISVLHNQCGYRSGETLLCGCSGGKDSVALVHLLHAAKLPIAVAHVNYHLRGEESIRDERYVAELCAQLQVPLYVKHSSPEELSAVDANLQQAARKIRYSFFEEITNSESISLVAIAHHSEDQLETVLMHFLRGSGLRGVTGMNFRSGNIIRPLLETSPEEITEYLYAHQISWCEDSSNASDNYLRNRIRHSLIPAIHELDERSGAGWEKTLVQLSATGQLLESFLQKTEKEIVRSSEQELRFSKTKLLQTPEPRILLNHLLDRYGFNMQFNEIQFVQLLNQHPGKQFFSGDLQLINDRDELILSVVQDFVSAEFDLTLGENRNGWMCEEIDPASTAIQSEFETLIAVPGNTATFSVRNWQAGDHMQPIGFRGTKKVSDILTEMKIPVHLKKGIQVLVHENNIVWIPGYRIAERYKITAHTKRAMRIICKMS